MAELLRVINEQSMRVEAGSIVTWCYSQHSQEGSPHGVWASKPTLPRDLLQSSADLLQSTTSRLDTDTLDEVGRSPPHIAAKNSTEVPHAHVDLCCQRLNGEVICQVLGSPALQITHRTAVCGLQFQEGAELRLASRSANKQDEVSGDGERNVPAEVGFHQAKSQIHTGRDTCGSVNIPIAHEDGIRVNGDLWVLASKQVTMRPVGDRAAAIEEPCGGEQEGTRAHRTHTSCVGSRPHDPAEQRRILSRLSDARAADNKESID